MKRTRTKAAKSEISVLIKEHFGKSKFTVMFLEQHGDDRLTKALLKKGLRTGRER